MELRTLSYFLAVAREQNMTEAANVLHVTQPTLSRQIADLENELGKKLFTRTSRSTILTEDGMHLRQRAEEILALVNQTEDELKNDTIDLSGCIRIGAGETHAMHILADLFADLHGRYPRLTVELFTGNADAVEEKLAHGLIDFALMIEPFNTEHYHFIRLPETMRVGIVTRDDSEWAAKDGITAEDLSEMPLLISSRQSANRFDFRQWSDGKLSAETMNIVGHFDLISNASHFIRTGIANAIGIDELLQLDTGHLKFIPLKPALTFSAVIVWKKYRLLSKSSSVFLEELRKRMTQ
ncbi:LysR family transcriptional regulator [Mitsuokella sp. AF33-22]|uniref:LysR family transcriptional regulator n=1 Tax=Mitsuokella sp. AF33-22 TaxID=2292047 RepID=UPI000E4BEB94|nr:LysR family transcriptional regulator [Mitsuokella sp. AF33-22]RHM56179.1 LysR family transcriptional regulator [Mitsuokella sp. AF33-22]